MSLQGNFLSAVQDSVDVADNQGQTRDIFSDKWESTHKISNVEQLYDSQYAWFLELYGFGSEERLRQYLSDKKCIIDTGCGLGYKSQWFAKLAPHAVVLGIDISDACRIAAREFHDLPNLFFLQADISATGLKPGVCDFMVCDQVIMHTEDPEATFAHLSECTSPDGEFACYFYRKKALPRELVDDYFRTKTHDISKEDMWAFSEQLTELGRRLSALNVSFECPEIPVLGIKAGKYDIQRFIYWNFLKCFWREDWGFELSKITNYDWYAPSNARRFSKEEVQALAAKCGMQASFFHEEEACYSGRFAQLHS